ASGQLFPLGMTTVECTAKDARGNVGSDEFNATVVDTTKPALNVPRGISVSTGGTDHIASSDPQVTAFLTAASALDIVDGPLLVCAGDRLRPRDGDTYAGQHGAEGDRRLPGGGTALQGQAPRGRDRVPVRPGGLGRGGEPVGRNRRAGDSEGCPARHAHRRRG